MAKIDSDLVDFLNDQKPMKITPKRISYYSEFPVSETLNPSITDLKNSNDILKFEVSPTKENFVNEIIATIHKSSLLYRFDIVENMENLIYCLFSEDMTPPALSFKYIIITYFQTPKVFIENLGDTFVNDCIVINLSHLLSPPKYSTEYEKLKRDSVLSKVSEYQQKQRIHELKLIGLTVASTGGLLYLGQKLLSKL